MRDYIRKLTPLNFNKAEMMIILLKFLLQAYLPSVLAKLTINQTVLDLLLTLYRAYTLNFHPPNADFKSH
jgi:hypothetical protein